MTRSGSWNPRPPEPLIAALVGAGFLLFLAAFTRFGPFSPAAPWLGTPPSAAPVPLTNAERVLGSDASLSGGAKADALAQDLLWLRARGAGPIVLEAWLDEAPQADARAFVDELRARFEALPRGRARSRGLQVLSRTAEELDAPERLSLALKDAQPLVLAFQAVPGRGAGLPAALQTQAYAVRVRGESKSLPPWQPRHLPFDEALRAARAGAVPVAAGDDDQGGPVAAVVCVNGQWINSLGLEAARLSLGLPLQGLRYRWTQGVLSSLELADVRHALSGDGGLLLPAQGGQGVLPSVSMDALRGDPAQAGHLRGLTIFFRPWPTQTGNAQSFDDQVRVFAALTRPRVSAPAPPPDGIPWTLVGGLLAALGLAYAPLWAAAPAWALMPLLAWGFLQGRPALLAQALAFAAAALMLGLGWRLQGLRSRIQAAERLLGGVVSGRHQVAWLRRLRLRKGSAALPAAYAVVGPRALMRGAVWEDWMERWGALMDENCGADGIGLVMAGRGADKAICGALLDLRRDVGGLSGALSQGTLTLRVDRRLGASLWQVQGPAKDLALDLFRFAQAGQILLSKKDFLVFTEFVEGRALGAKALAEAGAPPVQDSVMTILGPKAKLWPRRP